MRKARYFDSFVSNCQYFNGNASVNNGYGCDHHEQKETENGMGECFCWSCPLGYPADEESLSEGDILWVDGKPEAEDMEEDSYIIIK